MTPEELRKLGFYLDGLRYSLAMADVAGRRLTQTLDDIAQHHADGEHDEDQLASALLDAWTLVDMCHRTRELIQQTPGLSQTLPCIQVFLRGTGEAEKLRHYVQHFRSGIASVPSSWSPLWGALSWVPTHDQKTCYTMFTGNLLDGLSAPTISYDTHECRFTSEVRLFTGVAAADLLSIADRLKKLRACLLTWIDQHPAITRTEGKTLIWRFSVRRADPNAPNHLATIAPHRT